MKKAVQQIMLGTVTKTEKQALDTLKQIKSAGFDGIELNGFMIKPTSFIVRTLTKAAGMPTGKGGNFDWVSLLKEADLKAVCDFIFNGFELVLFVLAILIKHNSK